MSKKLLAASLLATCSVLAVSAPAHAQPALLDLYEVEELKPWVGALYPDTPAAAAHAAAAKSLAMASDNPIVHWQNRVWCETGYHNVNNLGTGQVADPLPDATKDLISPNGFYYRGYNDLISDAGGVKFLDNAWYFGTLNLGAVVVQTENGDLLLFDAFTTPKDTQEQLLDQMPAAGLDPARITHIFIGHQHGDHIGGINLIRDNHAPEAKVVAGHLCRLPRVDVRFPWLRNHHPGTAHGQLSGNCGGSTNGRNEGACSPAGCDPVADVARTTVDRPLGKSKR